MAAITDLSFGYPNSGLALFSHVSVKFDSPGIYALMGASGAGKTTLLKIIGGVIANYSGQIEGWETSGMGYVPQDSSLFPWLTVRENLDIGGKLLARKVPSAWKDELATAFGLSRSLDQWPRSLSGGMKQRAALISALTSGATTLLLDEPFSGSDRVCKSAMYAALRGFMDRGDNRLILFTTHDPSDVFATGAAAIWLDPESRQPIVISPRATAWAPEERNELLNVMAGEPG